MLLQLPLLFPCRDLGWHNGLRLTSPNVGVHSRQRANDDEENEDNEMEGDVDGGNSLTLMRWFAFRLFERPGDGVSLRFGGRLYQQWFC